MENKPGLAYNRKIGLVVMIVLILIASLFGSWRSLSAYKNTVDVYFWGGKGFQEISIHEDLATKTASARNLTVLVNRYMDEPTAKMLEELIHDLEASETVQESYINNVKLTTTVDEIEKRIEKTDINDQDHDRDKTAWAKEVANMRGQDKKISHSLYNEKAEAFNKDLDKFPANILHGLTGVGKCQLFSGETPD